MCMHAGQVPAPEYQGPTSKMPLGEVLRHAGAPEQVGQAQNDALISDGMRRMILDQFQDYLWIDRGGRAVCSACGAESISHAGHKDYLRCPNCGKYVQARHKRYGHKRLKETFYATQWQKSAVEKDALVMIGIYCEMDSSGVDPAHAKKLEKRLPELEKRYDFAFSGLVLRPARSRVELVNEGNALSHCVGGYFTAYADGRTDICFLRHEDEPGKPWRTIEFDVKTGKVIQDRGYKNDRAAGPGKPAQMSDELRAELDAFWAAFYAAHSELKAG